MIIGQLLSGVALSQLNVLALPEMLKQANRAFPGYEEVIANFCSGIFNSALGMGQISGPIIGAQLNKWYGFQTSQDFVALLNVAWILAYFLFAGGLGAFKTLAPGYKKKWLEEQKEAELKE